MADENRGYYAIIPANVRYDENLTANAKLLYGEITALCNEKGYCWANNGYFSKLYNVSNVSISKWISELEQKGYINRDIIYKDGTKEILNRYLRIVYDPIKENFNTPIKEKLKDNNTSSNNTINNTYILAFDDFYLKYPKKVSKDLTKKWFIKNKPDKELLNLIMISLDKHIKCEQWTKEDGKFIPMPSTWLNQKRWEDEVSKAKPQSKNKFNNFDEPEWDFADIKRQEQEYLEADIKRIKGE